MNMYPGQPLKLVGVLVDVHGLKTLLGFDRFRSATSSAAPPLFTSAGSSFSGSGKGLIGVAAFATWWAPKYESHVCTMEHVTRNGN